MEPVTTAFSSYETSVPEVLAALGAGRTLAAERRILLKPNLVTAAPHPVTTAIACCRAVIACIRACSRAEIVIAEGTGDPGDSTWEVFAKLGYTELSKETGATLMDLNQEPVELLKNSACKRLPELYLPKAARRYFIISLPVLKAHSLAGFTGSRKNMLGFAPPAHYAGAGGVWNKAALHRDLQQAVIDLNRYRSPDLTLMDASVGLPEQHLGGRICDPPVQKLLAGWDAMAVDRAAAGMLGLDWRNIQHLSDR
ncbi:MAG TPA: DUF362 domain-containing protein [Desulfosalsimonadaceae bacterium]|nr:DUF362 domain-containing protein [Desulfosalsimonadaceae bacterium]